MKSYYLASNPITTSITQQANRSIPSLNHSVAGLADNKETDNLFDSIHVQYDASDPEDVDSYYRRYFA